MLEKWLLLGAIMKEHVLIYKRRQSWQRSWGTVYTICGDAHFWALLLYVKAILLRQETFLPKPLRAFGKVEARLALYLHWKEWQSYTLHVANLKMPQLIGWADATRKRIDDTRPRIE